MILVMDTSAESVFIGLWDEDKSTWHFQESFLGGRELNSLIIKKLDKLFSYSQECENVSGIIVAAGPGSFTGLRIGLSVANTLAYVQDVPIEAIPETKTTEDLLQKGLLVLKSRGESFEGAAVPHYGSEPHITKPKPKG
jgi:tRNA threonylcarbamoyl adenosine modification protein YeaZ